MSNYRIAITMNQSTLLSLANGGFFLYTFGAVRCSDKAGVPAVSSQIQNYSLNTVVSLGAQLQAYTAPQSPLTPGQTIVPGFATDIELGQTLNINQAGSTGTVVNGGNPSAITVVNQTTTPAVCGTATEVSGAAVPVCAFPLYGNGIELIAPIASFLLLFSTTPAAPGTLVEMSKGPGVLVDCSGSPSRSVSFDINNGWSWGGYAWAQSVPANANLVPLLIQYSEALAAARSGLAKAMTA